MHNAETRWIASKRIRCIELTTYTYKFHLHPHVHSLFRLTTSPPSDHTMNFPIFATLFFSSLIAGSILDIRQDDCVEDQCFLAIWGDLDLSLALKAFTDCQSYVTTSFVVFPT